jgi:hypothetical protein
MARARGKDCEWAHLEVGQPATSGGLPHFDPPISVSSSRLGAGSALGFASRYPREPASELPLSLRADGASASLAL